MNISRKMMRGVLSHDTWDYLCGDPPHLEDLPWCYSPVFAGVGVVATEGAKLTVVYEADFAMLLWQFRVHDEYFDSEVLYETLWTYGGEL